jgi:hypothetical protein
VNDTHTRAYPHLDEALDPVVPDQEREHVRAVRAVLARCCHAGALSIARGHAREDLPVRTANDHVAPTSDLSTPTGG